MHKLNLTNFKRTVELLERMIQEDTNDERNQLAIIQAFEFCYGQYLDNIIRYMKIEYSNKYVDGMMTKDIINFLYKKQITNYDGKKWFHELRDARNKTSHEYQEEEWKKFYKIAQDFTKEARYTYEKLKLNLENEENTNN